MKEIRKVTVELDGIPIEVTVTLEMPSLPTDTFFNTSMVFDVLASGRETTFSCRHEGLKTVVRPSGYERKQQCTPVLLKKAA